jgi:phosphatidylglycerophosphate synthase
VRASQAGPATGLIAQILLLATFATTVGLGGVGWVIGVTCGVITNAALANGISRHRCDRLSPATWVTLGRATLAVGVAALVADSFLHDANVTLLVTLAAVALALDAIDGWVARRTGTASALGARFDGEVDAFLILVLSVYVARSAGAWVLAIGAARYAFLAAGWLLPWMRATLPPRYWRKVVTAAQGIVLTIATADVLPLALTRAALVAALAVLAESFGRDVWWLWRHRHALDRHVPPVGDGDLGLAGTPGGGSGHERLRTRIAAVLTILALLLVWVALVSPNKLTELTPSAFLRLPIEGLVVIALACLLPAGARRVLAVVVGPALALVVLVKILDMGFFTIFDRPFNPVDDWSYAGIGIETLRDSVGRARADAAVVVAAVLAVGVLVASTLAVLRLTRVAARHRGWSLRAVTTLGVVWVVCSVFGSPIASASGVDLAVNEVHAVQAGLRGYRTFVRELRNDPFRDTPRDQLLTSLRGKDVLLVFVESYGRVAVQDASISPRVDAVLDTGTEQLRAAGFSSRSGFLTSSTFGGLSWLAHSTVQSGVLVDSGRRYDHLVTSGRFTLNQAFQRAGWRAIDDVPSNDRTWREGSLFYHYDKLYDRRNVGYRGPTFGYASMPDQYVLLALQRLELAKAPRPPLFAEVDLVSSHIPWTRIPHLIGWSDVGDGSIFNRVPVDESTQSALFSDAERVRAAYGRSIEYSLKTLFSFVQHYGNDNLVLVVLGDHQPATIVSGEGASRDVPISVIAHDPAVLDRIAGWGWERGMRPSPRAPVWPMEQFRDRFLSAFGSRPAAP